MLRQLYAIMIKELKILLRDKSVLAVLFLLPLVFVTVMTFAGVGNQGIHAAEILVVNQDQGPIAERVIERLKSEKKLVVVDQKNGESLTEEASLPLLMNRGSTYAFILVFPPNFSQSLLSANKEESTVKFIADPATGGENLFPAERLIEIQVMNVAGAFAASREDDHTLVSFMEQSSEQTQNVLSALLQHFRQNLQFIDTKIQNRVHFQRVIPDGIVSSHPISAEEQNVPGYTIFGVFFIVQVIGNTFLREKESGTLNRLMIAPIAKPVLLLGKLIPFYLVNIIQVIFMFTFGFFVFHVSLGNSPLGLFAVTLATAAVANALGLFIASISKSAEQMGPLSGLILVCLATLGGIFIPYFEMPKILQSVSFWTPHAWALKGFQDILVRGYDFTASLPTVGMLLVFAFIFYIFAWFRFKFV